ncbi:MAG: hypothetical protein AAF671_11440, partial [Pseudomonadota bacterium]
LLSSRRPQIVIRINAIAGRIERHSAISILPGSCGVLAPFSNRTRELCAGPLKAFLTMLFNSSGLLTLRTVRL